MNDGIQEELNLNDAASSEHDDDLASDVLVLAREDKRQDVVYFDAAALEQMNPIERSLMESNGLLIYDDDEEAGISLRDGHRFIADAKRFMNNDGEFTISLPDWADQWGNESSWANSQRWSSNTTPRLVWSVDEMLVFQSPFILSMDERLKAMSLDVEWSDSLGGWVFPWFDDDMLEELRAIVVDYDFQTSAAASTLLNGTLDSEVVMDETIADALDDGYRLPSAKFRSQRTLKEHQQRGVLSALARRRVLLADSPGLGKGGIFVSAFLSEFELAIRETLELGDDDDYDFDSEQVQEIIESMAPVVLICQSSMVMPLAKEIHHWWNDAQIAIVSGQAQEDIPQCHFVVCPISIVAHRAEDILATEPAGLIVDECHMLKNPESNRTKAVQEIADYINEYGDMLADDGYRDSTLIILASGTPMPNRPAELWSILCILGEQTTFSDAALDSIGSAEIQQPYKRNGKTKWTTRAMSEKELFERRWCGAGFGQQVFLGGGKGYVWMNFGASNLSELHRVLSETVMIRRKKRDVIQLPAPYERIVPTPLSDEEMSEYQEIKEDFRNYMFDIADEYAEKWDVPIPVALKKLRYKIDFAEPLMRMAKLTQYVSKTKTPYIVDWVKRFMAGDPDIIDENVEKRRKLIVFAHHIETQKQLVENPELQEYGMATILAGAKNVIEETQRFQKDDDCRLMICYSGAREGHTLTAAYDVLIAEPPPVPSQAEQMACRCYARVSEDFEPHVAYVHYAITPNTVDVLQLRRMNLKKGISDAVIDGEDDPSRDDKKEKDKRNAQQKEAEAELLMEMVMRGDETMRIAT